MTKGKTDEHLARVVIRGTDGILPWMEARGVTFQPSLHGTLSLSRTNAFFLGGGKALLNAYYEVARHTGICVAYGTEVRSLRLEDGAVREVEIAEGGATVTICPKAVGGFLGRISSQHRMAARILGRCGG